MVGSKQYSSFKEVCQLLGLLNDNNQWHITLDEASSFKMPYQLRRIFATIRTHCDPANPFKLWMDHQNSLVEGHLLCLPHDDAIQLGLHDLNSLLAHTGNCLADFNIPMPAHNYIADNFDDGDVSQIAIVLRGILNPQKIEVADEILDAINSPCRREPKVYYLDGPGGCGKTSTYNYLAAAICTQCRKVATVAWTGIAATVLSDGRTVHSLFKLPVPLLDSSCCNISPTSNYSGPSIIRPLINRTFCYPNY